LNSLITTARAIAANAALTMPIGKPKCARLPTTSNSGCAVCIRMCVPDRSAPID